MNNNTKAPKASRWVMSASPLSIDLRHAERSMARVMGLLGGVSGCAVCGIWVVVINLFNLLAGSLITLSVLVSFNKVNAGIIT